jgi:hypothetical protein
MSDLAFGARYKNILKAVQRDGIDSSFSASSQTCCLNSVFFVFFFFFIITGLCAILKIMRRTTRSNNFVGIAKSSGSYETNQFTLEISFVFFFCSFKFIFQNFHIFLLQQLKYVTCDIKTITNKQEPVIYQEWDLGPMKLLPPFKWFDHRKWVLFSIQIMPLLWKIYCFLLLLLTHFFNIK